MSEFDVTLRTHLEMLGPDAVQADLEKWKKAIVYVCEGSTEVRSYETSTTRGTLEVKLVVYADSLEHAENIGQDINRIAWANGTMRPAPKHARY